jgi:hypothetical protein
MNDKSIILTREQLYEKVWSQPVWSLAKEWGLSDVGLAKICKKHNIPRPGLGYWRRKQLGYSVKQVPLPKGDGADVIEIARYRANPRIFDEEQAQEGREKGAVEEGIENRIVVAETLDDPHPLIVRTEKNLRGAKKDERGFLTAKAKGCLSVVSAPVSVERAMRIMDALIKALEPRGMRVRIEDGDHKSHIGSAWHQWWYSTYLSKTLDERTIVSVLGEDLDICLSEQIDRRERQPTPKEIKEHPWYRPPVYEYHPTGRFSLYILNLEGIRHTWSDTDKKRLEDLLNSFVKGLIKAAVYVRAKRLEREKEEREREERRRKIEEAKRLRREEEQKLKILDQHVSNWHQSQRIRQYVEAFREAALRKHGTIDPGSDIDKWITWAIQQADRVDPLVKSPPSILDEPEPSWW